MQSLVNRKYGERDSTCAVEDASELDNTLRSPSAAPSLHYSGCSPTLADGLAALLKTPNNVPPLTGELSFAFGLPLEPDVALSAQEPVALVELHNQHQFMPPYSVPSTGEALFAAFTPPSPDFMHLSRIEVPSQTQHRLPTDLYSEACPMACVVQAGANCTSRAAERERPQITHSLLRSKYHLPISKAAKELGMGVTVMKKYCRRMGINRWPFRKLNSMAKLINSVQGTISANGQQVDTLDSLLEEKKSIENDPSVKMRQQTKKLRQSSFKERYKIKHTRQECDSTS